MFCVRWVNQMSYLSHAGFIGGLLHILGAPTQRVTLESAVRLENAVGLASCSGLLLCLFVSSSKPSQTHSSCRVYKAFPLASGLVVGGSAIHLFFLLGSLPP